MVTVVILLPMRGEPFAMGMGGTLPMAGDPDTVRPGWFALDDHLKPEGQR
jgi:hypothetical protein